MKITLYICLLSVLIISCSYRVYSKDEGYQEEKSESKDFSTKVSYINDFIEQHDESNVSLADSTTREWMIGALYGYGKVTFVYDDIDSLEFRGTDAFAFLKEHLTTGRSKFADTLCHDFEICMVELNEENASTSDIIISEPFVIVHNNRQIVFMVTKDYKFKTIQLRDGDTTMLSAKYHLLTAMRDGNEWRGKITTDLN